MGRKDSEVRPTLEPSTPAEMIAALAQTIREQDAIIHIPGFLANAYFEWSGALESLGVYDRTQGVIRDVEKQLFAFFCAQLRVEEAEISTSQENLVFTEIISRSKPRT